MTDWRLSERRFNGGEQKVASRFLYFGVLYLGHSGSKCYETYLESCGIFPSSYGSIFIDIEQESSD